MGGWVGVCVGGGVWGVGVCVRGVRVGGVCGGVPIYVC